MIASYKKLETENFMLRLEVERLRMALQETQKEWAHPESCIRNQSPWK